MQTNRKFDVLIADYCGCFSTFHTDIENMFKNNIIKPQGIIITTFSRRDRNIRKKFPELTMLHIVDLIEKKIVEYGKRYEYNITPGASLQYNKMIVTPFRIGDYNGT